LKSQYRNISNTETSRKDTNLRMDDDPFYGYSLIIIITEIFYNSAHTYYCGIHKTIIFLTIAGVTGAA
ncbi:hypothetical protein SGI37_20155, partial [Providencia rettgeri]